MFGLLKWFMVVVSKVMDFIRSANDRELGRLRAWTHAIEGEKRKKQRAKEIDNEVDRMSDDDVVDSLRKFTKPSDE